MTPRVRGAAVLAVVLALLLLGSVLVAVGLGSVRLPPADVAAVVLRRMHLVAGDGVSAIDDRIVWQLRLPRVVATAAVGAVLALCGVVLQALTRNDLADPYLLGISSGAAVGAVLVLVFGVGLSSLALPAAMTLASFVGGLVALALVLAMATGRGGDLPPSRTILAGVAVAQLAGAFTSLAIMVFGERDLARQVLSWTLGSFASVRWTQALALLVLGLVAVLVLVAAAGVLDAFAFGDVSAQALGIPVTRARWTLLVLTALLTAGTVAVVGPIGFVGLTVPHLVRIVVGPTHRALLPLSALAGALRMVWADTLARTVREGEEIPVGVVTAVLGAPLLVVLLRRQARRG